MTEGRRFCPRCRAERPILASHGDGPLRCQTCGSPFPEPAPKDSKAAAGPGNPMVLHIDDDPVLGRVVAALLAKDGFTPLTASDGESGLALAQREKPAAVLLDVVMPGLDGYEVARRLRASPGLENLAIIMLTSGDDPKLNAVAFKAGADMTIRDPFDKQ